MMIHNEEKRLLRVIAGHIRSRRKVLGLTQERLAEKAGLSANYVARLELALKTPSLDTLIELARALNVRVSDLLTENAEEWIDEAQELANSLHGLEQSQADFAIKQFRDTVGYFKEHRREGATKPESVE